MTKVKYISFGLLFIVSMTTIVLNSCVKTKIKPPTSAELIQQSNLLIEQDSFQIAIRELEKISVEDDLYQQAQLLKIKADSLQTVQKERELEEKRIKAEKELEEKKIKAEQELKEKLNQELNLIKAGIDFSVHRGSYENILSAVDIFVSWKELAVEGDSSKNNEINKLSAQLRNSAVKIQVREYPILRKEYANILSSELWIDDISVSVSGNGNIYLNLTGGTFASNSNKKKYADELYQKLAFFNFKEIRFRWYKGQDEYTYWKIRHSFKDSDLGNHMRWAAESMRKLNDETEVLQRTIDTRRTTRP